MPARGSARRATAPAGEPFAVHQHRSGVELCIERAGAVRCWALPGGPPSARGPALPAVPTGGCAGPDHQTWDSGRCAVEEWTDERVTVSFAGRRLRGRHVVFRGADGTWLVRALDAAPAEGAPLVPYLDWALFRKPGVARALQNLGGIGNVSVVSDRIEDTIAFDTGPGNALLDRAARARSVRRYLAARPALGVALVEPDDVAALTRVLARQQIIATVKRQHHSVPASPPAALHPGDAAALLVACAFYQQHAPASAPLLPQPELLARLRTCLSRPLDAAVTAALADLSPPPLPTRPAPPSPLSSAEALPILTHALQAYTPIRMTYYTASRDAWSERVVRPLALEQCNDQWYLRAYCLSRQAERTFLVDRIGALVPLTQEQMLPASSGKPTTHEATLPLRAWETISVESLLAFG